jgi:hypothetical protein
LGLSKYVKRHNTEFRARKTLERKLAEPHKPSFVFRPEKSIVQPETIELLNMRNGYTVDSLQTFGSIPGKS